MNNFIGSFPIIEVVMGLILFFLIKKFNKHPITYIGLSAVVGILIGL